MSLEAERIRIEDVRRVWPLIAPEIARCMEEDSSDASIEDVLDAILSGSAVLYLTMKGNKHCGLLVLQHVKDVFSGRRSVHIWYAWGLVAGVGNEGLELIESIARANGAEYVSFKCQSRAVVKWAERRGFAVSDIEMRREVSNGLTKSVH